MGNNHATPKSNDNMAVLHYFERIEVSRCVEVGNLKLEYPDVGNNNNVYSYV